MQPTSNIHASYAVGLCMLQHLCAQHGCRCDSCSTSCVIVYLCFDAHQHKVNGLQGQYSISAPCACQACCQHSSVCRSLLLTLTSSMFAAPKKLMMLWLKASAKTLFVRKRICLHTLAAQYMYSRMKLRASTHTCLCTSCRWQPCTAVERLHDHVHC